MLIVHQPQALDHTTIDKQQTNGLAQKKMQVQISYIQKWRELVRSVENGLTLALASMASSITMKSSLVMILTLSYTLCFLYIYKAFLKNILFKNFISELQ